MKFRSYYPPFSFQGTFSNQWYVVCSSDGDGWDFTSRSDLIKYAKKNNIPVPSDKKGAPPFSVDDNLFHTSTEGKILEDPSKQAPEFIFQRTVSPEKAPNKPSYVTIGFKNGDPISINNKKYSPSKLLSLLNNIAAKME